MSPPAAGYDLLAPEHLDDPYPLYRGLREQGPVHWSERLGGWALTDHAGVHAGLGAGDLSAERFAPNLERLAARPDADPGDVRLYESLAAWFSHMDPPAHSRLRTHTRRVLSAPMKAMRAPVEALTDALLDRIEAAGEADVIGDFARPVSVGAIADLLGVPREHTDRFTEWSDLLTQVVGGATGVADRRARALAGISEMDAYLLDLVRRRRVRPTPDLLGRLAALEGPDAPGDAEIAAIGATTLFAGHGTTTNLIGNGLVALLRHPEQLALLRREPERVPAAVEELLRYDSPVQVTVRLAARDGALGIPQIARGDRVFLLIGAANHDPAAFEAPDTLDVLRREPRHLSFGYGIHFCLGAPLARIEAPIALGRMIARFPGLQLAVPERELRRQPTVGFRGLQRLPVTVR